MRAARHWPQNESGRYNLRTLSVRPQLRTFFSSGEKSADGALGRGGQPGSVRPLGHGTRGIRDDLHPCGPETATRAGAAAAASRRSTTCSPTRPSAWSVADRSRPRTLPRVAMSGGVSQAHSIGDSRSRPRVSERVPAYAGWVDESIVALLLESTACENPPRQRQELSRDPSA